MSEFKEHQLITELLQLFGSSVSLDECLNIIKSNLPGYAGNLTVVVQDKHLQEVVKNSPNPQAFLRKYNELMEKKTDSLGSFVELLYIVNKDTTLKKLFKKTTRRITPSLYMNEPLTRVTKDDIPELKNKLLNAVSKEKTCTSKIPKSIDSQQNQFLEQISNWAAQRPNMSWDFIVDDIAETISLTSTNLIPYVSQEHYLIDDLLFVLSGIEGRIIQPLPVTDKFSAREFIIKCDIDSSYRDIVHLILPLASHYSIVQRFIEDKMKFEAGQVNHALVAAMNAMIKEYLYFICQLEAEHKTEKLTLQKMWFYIQRNMLSMSVMADIATTIANANAKGGRVLTLLHDHLSQYMADTKAHDLCSLLTERAVKPYMEMLQTWIYTGVINDPFKEFLVEDNQILKKSHESVTYADDFWEKRYSVRRERIPIFLEKVADIILGTGKYLNVVRQCGKPIKMESRELIYHPENTSYVEAIHQAYFNASQLLQHLLMDENDLIGRLRSVKRYFLLEQGDFIVQFMNLCEKELSKDINKVIVPRLETLFELALRLSVANNDPYKDDMKIELLPYDLQSQMFKILSIHTHDEQDYRCSSDKPLTGLESFSFGYEVKWPVSLVLHRRAVACYQMIFRHLFYCKHVERQICRVWICNKEAKIFGQNEAKQYRTAFALRQRMLNCVQNLEYHMMVEVIEPNWQAFQEKVTKMVDIDEILKCHNDFLDMCLKDCMLTNPLLLRTVTKLLQTCVEFCSFIMSPEHSLSNSLSTSMTASMFQAEQTSTTTESSITESESFEQSIKRFDIQFSTILLSLMDKINDLGRQNTNDKLVNLLYRLDFNSFYGSQLEQLTSYATNDFSG